MSVSSIHPGRGVVSCGAESCPAARSPHLGAAESWPRATSPGRGDIPWDGRVPWGLAAAPLAPKGSEQRGRAQTRPQGVKSCRPRIARRGLAPQGTKSSLDARGRPILSAFAGTGELVADDDSPDLPPRRTDRVRWERSHASWTVGRSPSSLSLPRSGAAEHQHRRLDPASAATPGRLAPGAGAKRPSARAPSCLSPFDKAFRAPRRNRAAAQARSPCLSAGRGSGRESGGRRRRTSLRSATFW
jgi:hypothetical protein